VRVAAVTSAVSVPVVAIGGIDVRRVAEVLAVGAADVAVISAIIDADEPREAARGLREALDAEAERIREATAR